MSHTCNRWDLETKNRSPRAGNYFHELVDLLTPLFLVSVLDRVGNAMRDVITQDLILNPVEGGFDSLELGDDVDAVAVFLDHTGDAAHLAFNAAEPTEA